MKPVHVNWMINAIERIKDEKIVICNGWMRSWLFQSIFDCLHIWVMQDIPQQTGTGQIACLIAYFHSLVVFKNENVKSESKIWFCLAYWFLRILTFYFRITSYLKMSGMPWWYKDRLLFTCLLVKNISCNLCTYPRWFIFELSVVTQTFFV
jgi:hypothetical protein